MDSQKAYAVGRPLRAEVRRGHGAAPENHWDALMQFTPFHGDTLADHLVCLIEDDRWNREAEGLGSSEVDD